jgi:hypothetical protein
VAAAAAAKKKKKKKKVRAHSCELRRNERRFFTTHERHVLLAQILWTLNLQVTGTCYFHLKKALLQEVSTSKSRLGQEIFLYTTASRSALGLTLPLIQWVPGRQADHSSPSSDEVKNAGAIPPLPTRLRDS